MWNINKVEKTVGNVGHSQSSAAEISGNLLHRSAFNRGENGSLTVAAEKFQPSHESGGLICTENRMGPTLSIGPAFRIFVLLFCSVFLRSPSPCYIPLNIDDPSLSTSPRLYPSRPTRLSLLLMF